MNRNILLMSCAVGALTFSSQSAWSADVAATATVASDAGNAISELVVTAEKREQNLQTVPIAISAFTGAKRQLIGIDSIQDITNFTPGLEYNSSTDRISLRGVGRLTNVLSADASVANYSDGIYETFAVGAGASTLFVDRVEVLRGPQGTLYGRNSIGGAINIISRRPTKTPYAEVRGTYSNYDHYNIEAAISGPITDNIQARLAGNFEKQSKGWIHNNYPGAGDEGNIIEQAFLEGQVQWRITDNLEAWVKVGYNQWNNSGGGVGAASGGWTPFPYETSEYANTATQLNPGYGCSGSSQVTNVVNKSPTGCGNPAINSPWQESRPNINSVRLPYAYTVSGTVTYHLPFADVKYITGGVNYHYILKGPSSGTDGQGVQAPVTSYTIPGLYGKPLVINPAETSVYQELNAFWSHEINLISTSPGPLQWVVGGYYYRQHYRQPVYTEDPAQSQWSSTPVNSTVPGNGHRFDNRPSVTNKSFAVFGQADYKVTDTLKFTGGLRYSHDQKYGSESVRILCFAVANCTDPTNSTGVNPNLLGGYTPVVDLTRVPSVVSTGLDANGNLLRGVSQATTYDPTTGFATRRYDASWSAVTGTAGVDWTPDSSTLVYGKYSRGYKSGGYNIGIFTVLSFQPYTDAEHVDSYEVGFKKTFFHTVTTDIAAFYYNYQNLQVPITVVGTAGGLVQASTAFYNVPTSVSRGVELETTWAPTRALTFLFDYSYLDAYATGGSVVDITDPTAMQPGATPDPAATKSPDIYTGGRQTAQLLTGNRLPNAPRNKIALNANYSFDFAGGNVNTSVSYIWRDAQYGTLFTRYYNKAPAWDQYDARVTWNSPNGRTKVIFFGKNIFNTIGYDAGAFSRRAAGVNVLPGVNAAGKPGLYQVPGIEAVGITSTYSVTPPRTYGVEVDFKFF